MLNSFPMAVLAGTILGFLSGLGIGGGSLLILWLTVVLEMEPATAREINLLFFLPASAVSCIFRRKQGALHLKKTLPAVIAGCVAAVFGSLLSGILDTDQMKKAFGVLLLAAGLREILYKAKDQAAPKG